MEYFTHVGLKNFRFFDNTAIFTLAPITLITGTNSSGKSSLIKTLQLFNSSISDLKNLKKLSFANGKHTLGSFRNVINKKSKNDQIEFVFNFELPVIRRNALITLKYIPINKKSEEGKLVSYKMTLESGEILLETMLSGDNHDSVKSHINMKKLFSIFSDFFDEKYLEQTRKIDNELKQGWCDEYLILRAGGYAKLLLSHENIFTLFKHIHIRDGIYRDDNLFLDPDTFDNETNYIQNLSVKESYLNDKIDIEIENIFETGIEMETSEISDDIFSIPLHSINFWSSKISSSIPEIRNNGWSSTMKYLLEKYLPNLYYSLFDFHERFFQIDYLSSLRANTSRLYSNTSDIADINSIIYEFSQIEITKDDKILNFINKQFSHFEIGDNIEILRHQGVSSEISILKNGEKTLLADLGYGYSQFLPLILKVALIAYKKRYYYDQGKSLYNYPPSFLLLEEPESNLHPSNQSKLADFMIDAATEFNIQLLIETHSEYMIRKFQYLVATKKLESDGINIYYFNRPGTKEFDESPHRKIEILENGRLSGEFGQGFFDETPRLLADLFNSNFN